MSARTYKELKDILDALYRFTPEEITKLWEMIKSGKV